LNVSKKNIAKAETLKMFLNRYYLPINWLSVKVKLEWLKSQDASISKAAIKWFLISRTVWCLLTTCISLVLRRFSK